MLPGYTFRDPFVAVAIDEVANTVTEPGTTGVLGNEVWTPVAPPLDPDDPLNPCFEELNALTATNPSSAGSAESNTCDTCDTCDDTSEDHGAMSDMHSTSCSASMASMVSGATSASGSVAARVVASRKWRFGDPATLLDSIRETLTAKFCEVEDAAYQEVMHVHDACRTTEGNLDTAIQGLKEQNEKLRQGIIDAMYGVGATVDIAVEGDNLEIDPAWLWYYNQVFTPHTLVIPADDHVQWLYAQALAGGDCA